VKNDAIRGLSLVLTIALSGILTGFSNEPANGSGMQQQLIGSWDLASRTTRLDSGQTVTDPTLGEQPSGVLIYDATGHMAAQLSRKARTVEMLGEDCRQIASVQTAPNTANTILGYDAYFGTYTVDTKQSVVTHHVKSALWPGNVGKDIQRAFVLRGDELTISFKTTNEQGQAVTRTLIWHRLR
jgi:Lipocalin-like domain